ncbi:hypothetical protein ONA91_12820 [Micromonospora sp. DR5-3]|uniref:hypothetical protein n=1 Tax=unclassified Micromonospora TaxID=2617518 RepID=UPI0011D34C1A|nr:MULTISPECIES: hypothetical protein [unclassified Micromonospora]MCW3815337.1 hypothetical protein [Micromonospora sp. DR5-3]TYC22795.1 hypothetical protein FXF52_18535 [Micromonospora sp. MP36]
MIPEANRPAGWLRDYGAIEADIRQMREFADRLQDEVLRNYAPHLSYIADDMKAAIPNPADAFIELVQFLQAHHETQTATAEVVWGLVPATGHLAGAAHLIATRYADSDAFSSAQVADVQEALARSAGGGSRPLPALTDPSAADDRPVVLP